MIKLIDLKSRKYGNCLWVDLSLWIWYQRLAWTNFSPGCMGYFRRHSILATWLCLVLLWESCVVSTRKQNHFSSTVILLLNHKFCYIAKGSDILVMLTQCTLFVFRSGRLHGNKCLCEEDLHKCENRLETQQQCCGSADTSSRSMRAQSLHLFCKKRLWYLVQNLVFHFLNELKVAAWCVHKGKMRGVINRTFLL